MRNAYGLLLFLTLVTYCGLRLSHQFKSQVKCHGKFATNRNPANHLDTRIEAQPLANLPVTPEFIRIPGQSLKVQIGPQKIAQAHVSTLEVQGDVHFDLESTNCDPEISGIPENAELRVSLKSQMAKVKWVWIEHPSRVGRTLTHVNYYYQDVANRVFAQSYSQDLDTDSTLYLGLLHAVKNRDHQRNAYQPDIIQFTSNGRAITPTLNNGVWEVERITFPGTLQNAYTLRTETTYSTANESTDLNFEPLGPNQRSRLALRSIGNAYNMTQFSWLSLDPQKRQIIFWIRQPLGPTNTLCKLIWKVKTLRATLPNQNVLEEAAFGQIANLRESLAPFETAIVGNWSVETDPYLFDAIIKPQFELNYPQGGTLNSGEAIEEFQ